MTLLWQLAAALRAQFKELKRRAASDEWRESVSTLILRLTGGVVLTVHGVSELPGDHDCIAAIALANLGIHPTTATSLVCSNWAAGCALSSDYLPVGLL